MPPVMCNQPPFTLLRGSLRAVGSYHRIELKLNGKEFKPGAQVGGKGILRNLAFFGVRGDPLQKRILTAAEALARETMPPERAGEFYEAKRGRSASHA